MISRINPFQIFSDGEDLAVIMTEDNGQQTAYIFKNALFRNFQISIPPPIDISNSANRWKNYMTVDSFIDVSLDIRAHQADCIIGDDLLIRLDIFNKKTISELMQIVHKKLNQREKSFSL